MQGTNEKCVVGVFEDYTTAERVARDLTNAGIPRESIQVKSNFMTGAAGRTTGPAHEHEGGISGFFHRLFGSEDTEYGNYDEAVRRGNAVVLVTAPSDQIDNAAHIMNSAGAIDIDRHVERYRQTGYENYDANAEPYSYEQATEERQRFRGSDERAAIPVVEEEVRVGKRTVRRGGVRVYSHVVDQPVEQDIQLRDESVRVERRPVDRPLGDEDAARMKDQSIEVEEISEEPVVEKRARVKEEVVVGKETKERTERVRDTVRRTQVEVEPLTDGNTAGETGYGSANYDADFRRNWQDRYASSGESYETYQPAYEFGYRSASDPRYRGRNWPDVERELESEYTVRNPRSSWAGIKDAVRYGWDKVTARA
jgi:uncharacterized protein (TIGR02271 family)